MVSGAMSLPRSQAQVLFFLGGVAHGSVIGPVQSPVLGPVEGQDGVPLVMFMVPWTGWGTLGHDRRTPSEDRDTPTHRTEYPTHRTGVSPLKKTGYVVDGMHLTVTQEDCLFV